MIGGEGREEGKTVDGSLGPLATGVAKLPLVSLVIINWNYADYVGDAIESLKAQDYPELEIVVVDNGSTDRSREVIAARRRRRPSVFRHQYREKSWAAGRLLRRAPVARR